MPEFALAQAADKPADELVAACAVELASSHGHTLGFVYATSPLADAFPKIVTALKQRTGIEDWFGTVGLGVCATGAGYFDRNALVTLTCRVDAKDFQLIPPISDPVDIEAQIGPDVVAPIAIVHADPRNPRLTELIAGVAERSGAYLVGGLTSAENTFPQAAGGRVSETGISGVLIGGPNMNVAVGLTQGCSPIGPVHTVSRADGQVLIALDRRPAYEVLREDVGAAKTDDPRHWLANIHAAIPVPGSDRADYVVRNLAGIGPDEGLVAIADFLEPGDRVMFVRRDPGSAARDLARMLGELKGRSNSAKPKAGLYFSCLARGPNLFPEDAYELKAIRTAFGDIPIAGFFGNGEIAHHRLYGYTGVLALFF